THLGRRRSDEREDEVAAVGRALRGAEERRAREERRRVRDVRDRCDGDARRAVARLVGEDDRVAVRTEVRLPLVHVRRDGEGDGRAKGKARAGRAGEELGEARRDVVEKSVVAFATFAIGATAMRVAPLLAWSAKMIELPSGRKFGSRSFTFGVTERATGVPVV